jgi:hypothetical protein
MPLALGRRLLGDQRVMLKYVLVKWGVRIVIPVRIV